MANKYEKLSKPELIRLITSRSLDDHRPNTYEAMTKYDLIKLITSRTVDEKNIKKYEKLSRLELIRLIKSRSIDDYVHSLMGVPRLQHILMSYDEKKISDYKINTQIKELNQSIYDLFELDEKNLAQMISRYIIRFTGGIYVFKDVSAQSEIKNNNNSCKIFVSNKYIGCINRHFYIFIYDAYNGDHIWTYKCNKQINNATFHPNEKTIAIIKSHQIDILDIKSQNITQTYMIPNPHYTLCVVYSKDGRYLACGTNLCIYLYDLVTDTCRQLGTGPDDSMYKSVVFSPDSKYIAKSMSCEPYVILWSVEAGAGDGTETGSGSEGWCS